MYSTFLRGLCHLFCTRRKERQQLFLEKGLLDNVNQGYSKNINGINSYDDVFYGIKKLAETRGS